MTTTDDETAGTPMAVAECLLPGLTVSAARAFGQRVRDTLAAAPHDGVAFLGSVLMTEDEVLLCMFSGPLPAVRAVSEHAGLPFERIVTCVGVGWPRV